MNLQIQLKKMYSNMKQFLYAIFRIGKKLSLLFSQKQYTTKTTIIEQFK